MMLRAITTRPASLAVTACLTAVFAAVLRAGGTAATVGLTASSVVDERRVWLCVTAQLVHLDAVHLAANLVALLSLGPDAEARRGSFIYLHHSALLAVIVGAITTAALAARRKATPHVPQPGIVGYSGVLFGWMAALAADQGDAKVTTPLFGVQCPALLWPILVIVAIKIVIPSTSATAHTAGVVAGVALSAGAFNWLTPSLLATLCGWAVALALYARRAAEDESADVEAGRTASPVVVGV